MQHLYFVSQFGRRQTVDGRWRLSMHGDFFAFTCFAEALAMAKEQKMKVLAFPEGVDFVGLSEEQLDRHTFDPGAYWWTDDEVKAIGT